MCLYTIILLLPQNLSCQACKLIGVDFLQRHDFWFKVEQELHIGGERQEVAVAAYVIVTKLDKMLHAILHLFLTQRYIFLATFAIVDAIFLATFDYFIAFFIGKRSF